MITRRMIERGIDGKIVQFVADQNLEGGTVCQIGDSWFYFGGMTAEELSPEEYLSCVPKDNIVSDLYDALESFRNDEECMDEYDYYEAVLTYRNDL